MSSDDDLIQALRAANPISSTSSPDAAERAARFEEITSMPDQTSTPAPSPVRRRWIYTTAAAASVAAVVIGVAIATREVDEPQAAPVTTTTVEATPPSAAPASSDAVLSPGGPTMGSCVEFYDLETLTQREFAFNGTVSAIAGQEVTFSVEEWFKGGIESTVTLDANGMAGAAVTSAGGPTLAVGEHLLVAGDDGFVWSCGFTQPFDAATAAAWRGALA